MMRTPEELIDLIRRYIAAFNARDFDLVESLYAEDATLEDPVGTPVHEGRAAIRAFYETFRNEPSFLQLTGQFRFPEDAAAFTFSCTMGDESAPMVIDIIDTFRFDERGLIKEMRAFWGPANVRGAHSSPIFSSDGLSLAGQVALVSGTGDTARACAVGLADRGALVVLAGSDVGTKSIAKDIFESGGRAKAVAADLADKRVLADLPRKAAAVASRLDICVNALSLNDVGKASSLPDLTAFFAGEQLLSFHDTTHEAVIVSIVESGWREAMPEAVRGAGSHAARINCIEVSNWSDARDIARTVCWLASDAAIGIDSQVIALTGRP